MSATLCVLILTCGSTVVSLSPPTNVRLTSYNMDLVLRWSPPAAAPPGLVYTTQYRYVPSKFRAGCVNISTLDCDFTALNLTISEHGIYMARVKVQQEELSSDWVESQQIIMDEDTTIGPPHVTLLSSGAAIDVTITDPVFRKPVKFEHVYSHVSYNISYWRQDQEQQVRSKEINGQNRVVLSDLEPWTRYCVQVQIHTRQTRRPSQPSPVVCESTSDREGAPWGSALAGFLVMALLLSLAVPAVLYRKKISHFLCPRDTLPEHYKEYLLAPPSSSVSPPPVETYHPISIIADDQRQEARPSEDAPETSP